MGGLREAALSEARPRAALPGALHPSRRDLESPARRRDYETVSFRCKDYRHQSRVRTLTLDDADFLRRFLLHFLPNASPDPLLRGARDVSSRRDGEEYTNCPKRGTRWCVHVSNSTALAASAVPSATDHSVRVNACQPRLCLHRAYRAEDADRSATIDDGAANPSADDGFAAAVNDDIRPAGPRQLQHSAARYGNISGNHSKHSGVFLHRERAFNLLSLDSHWTSQVSVFNDGVSVS